MKRLGKIVKESIDLYINHIIRENNESINAKDALINMLNGKIEITIPYDENGELNFDEDKSYDFFIDYSLTTNAYEESDEGDYWTVPSSIIRNDNTDEFYIISITAFDKDTDEEIKIDDTDKYIENLIRKKMVPDDSNYEYPSAEDIYDRYDEYERE